MIETRLVAAAATAARSTGRRASRHALSRRAHVLRQERAPRLADRFHLKILSANALLTAGRATDVGHGRSSARPRTRPALRPGGAARDAGGRRGERRRVLRPHHGGDRAARHENEHTRGDAQAAADGDIPEDELPDNFPSSRSRAGSSRTSSSSRAGGAAGEGPERLRPAAARRVALDRASSLAQPLNCRRLRGAAWRRPTSATVPSASTFVYLEADRDLTLQRAPAGASTPRAATTTSTRTAAGRPDLQERLVEPLDQTNPAANLSLQVSAHASQPSRCSATRAPGAVRR